MYSQSVIYNKYYWMTLATAALLVFNISICIYCYIENSCMHHTYIKVMIISFKFSILKVVHSINTPVTFQRKDISEIHHLPPMPWSAQYPGLGFTQPELLPWLPTSSTWSNVAVGHQTIIQSISKLREEAPSIYMDGIYKENEKLPNYEIRYAHLLHNTYRSGIQ